MSATATPGPDPGRQPITAEMVKKLRDQTGAGMMDCKAALTEAKGDFEEAISILRKRGLASAAKKAGRSTNEGLNAARSLMVQCTPRSSLNARRVCSSSGARSIEET